MCRHCEKLTEDKEIVHAFMERAAARLSADSGHTITADDLEVSITLIFPPPMVTDFRPASRVLKMLREMYR